MTKDTQRIVEGYKPEKVEKGYQPSKPQGVPASDPKPLGGLSTYRFQAITQQNNPNAAK